MAALEPARRDRRERRRRPVARAAVRSVRLSRPRGAPAGDESARLRRPRGRRDDRSDPRDRSGPVRAERAKAFDRAKAPSPAQAARKLKLRSPRAAPRRSRRAVAAPVELRRWPSLGRASRARIASRYGEPFELIGDTTLPIDAGAVLAALGYRDPHPGAHRGRAMRSSPSRSMARSRPHAWSGSTAASAIAAPCARPTTSRRSPMRCRSCSRRRRSALVPVEVGVGGRGAAAAAIVLVPVTAAIASSNGSTTATWMTGRHGSDPPRRWPCVLARRLRQRWPRRDAGRRPADQR